MIRSVRRHLTILALASIGCVMLPLLVLSYAKVVEEVNELSDARLAQSAKTLEALSSHLVAADPGATIEVPNWSRPRGSSEASPQGHGYETQVGFQYWSTATHLEVATQDLRELSFYAAPVGFADVMIGRRKWRVYTKIGDAGGFIRAAERYDSRREIARDLLLQNLLPLALGLPLLALLMGWVVRNGLQPISYAASRIEARLPDATGPLEVHDVPNEMAPLISAINGLLSRSRRLLDDERESTSNALQALRTSLAGGLVDVRNARAAAGPGEREGALAEALRALERTTDLVDQMLERAR